MSIDALALYTVTLIVAVASPGPAVAAIVGFVLGRGLAGAFAFIAGIIFGEFFWLAASIFGVEAVIARFPNLLLFMRLFGVGYLLYMAFGLWQSAGAKFTASTIKGGYFAGGLALSATNPKVMVFYLSLLPALIAGQTLGVFGYVVYAFIMLLVTTGVFTAYALFASRMRDFLDDPVKLKRTQQINALILAGVAVMILFITLRV